MQTKRNLFGRPVSGVDEATGLGSEIAASLPSALAAEAEGRALWARYGL